MKGGIVLSRYIVDFSFLFFFFLRAVPVPNAMVLVRSLNLGQSRYISGVKEGHLSTSTHIEHERHIKR